MSVLWILHAFVIRSWKRRFLRNIRVRLGGYRLGTEYILTSDASTWKLFWPAFPRFHLYVIHKRNNFLYICHTYTTWHARRIGYNSTRFDRACKNLHRENYQFSTDGLRARTYTRIYLRNATPSPSSINTTVSSGQNPRGWIQEPKTSSARHRNNSPVISDRDAADRRTITERATYVSGTHHVSNTLLYRNIIMQLSRLEGFYSRFCI